MIGIVLVLVRFFGMTGKSEPSADCFLRSTRRRRATRRQRDDAKHIRSAWESVPPKNRPVGYGMIGRSSSHRQRECFQFLYLKFRHANHRIGAHTCTNHTVPYGTALWGGVVPGTSCLGYDQPVPPGQKRVHSAFASDAPPYNAILPRDAPIREFLLPSSRALPVWGS